MVFKDVFVDFDVFLLVYVCEIEGLEGFWGVFDNKCCCIIVELVGMCLDLVVFGFFEYEGEGVGKGLMCVELDEMVFVYVNIWFEGICVECLGFGI